MALLLSIINTIVFLFVVFFILSLSLAQHYPKVDDRNVIPSPLVILSFVISWNLAYCHILWNQLWLHAIFSNFLMRILLVLILLIFPRRMTEKIVILSISLVLTIWMTNQIDLFRLNLAENDRYWPLPSIQEWFRLGIWGLAGCHLVIWWGRWWLGKTRSWLATNYEWRLRRATEKHLRQASQLMAQGRTEQAEKILMGTLKILDNYPGSLITYKARSHLQLGHTFWQKGQSDLALSSYRRASQLGVVDEWSSYRIALDLFKKNEYSAIDGHFAKFAPQSVESRLIGGRSLLRQRQTGKSISIFESACESDTTNWKLHYYLGCAYGENRSYRDALRSLLYAHELAPQEQSIVAQIGRAYHLLGDKELAYKYYKDALDMGNPTEVISLGMAILLMETGDYSGALQFAKNELIAPDSRWLIIGVIYEKIGKIEQAEASFLELTRDGKISVDICVQLGMCLLLQEKFDESVVFLEKALGGCGEGESQVRYNLGWAEYKRGNLEKCLFHWRICLESSMGEGLQGQLVKVEYLHSKRLFAEGLLPKAIQAMEEYRRSGEDTPHVRQFLAEMHFRLAAERANIGDVLGLKVACELLEEAEKIDRNPARSRYYRALAESGLGQFEKARELLERVPQESALAHSALYQAELCDAARGAREAALAGLERILHGGTGKETDMRIRLSLAAMKMCRKEWQQACELLTAMEAETSVFASEPLAQEILSYCLFRAGQRDQLLCRPTSSAYVLFCKAAMMVTSGNEAEALENLMERGDLIRDHRLCAYLATLVSGKLLLSWGWNESNKESLCENLYWLTHETCLPKSVGLAIFAALALQNRDSFIEPWTPLLLNRTQAPHLVAPEVAHSLAVLGALIGFRLLDKGEVKGAGPFMECMAANIAYLLTNDHFWQKWLPLRTKAYGITVDEEHLQELKQSLKKYITKQITRRIGASVDSEVRHTLESMLHQWELELEAAAALGTSAIFKEQLDHELIVVGFGPLFMQQCGLMQRLKQCLSEQQRHGALNSLDEHKIRLLIRLFSELAPAEMFARMGNHDKALEALKPDSTGNERVSEFLGEYELERLRNEMTTEIQILAAEDLLRQRHPQLDRVARYWSLALESAKNWDGWQSVVDEICQAALGRANGLEQKHLNDAINVLRTALRLIPNEKLTGKLAHYLRLRAVIAANRAVENGVMDELAEFVPDLLESIRLNPYVQQTHLDLCSILQHCATYRRRYGNPSDEETVLKQLVQAAEHAVEAYLSEPRFQEFLSWGKQRLRELEGLIDGSTLTEEDVLKFLNYLAAKTNNK